MQINIIFQECGKGQEEGANVYHIIGYVGYDGNKNKYISAH